MIMINDDDTWTLFVEHMKSCDLCAYAYVSYPLCIVSLVDHKISN